MFSPWASWFELTFYEQHVDSSTLVELAAESHISFKAPSRKGTS